MLKEWEKLLEQAEEKATAANAIYADSPDEAAEATADEMMARAQALTARSEKMEEADAIKAKADAAKAARLALENEPPVNDNGGFAIPTTQVKDPSDTPYKHVGEFLTEDLSWVSFVYDPLQPEEIILAKHKKIGLYGNQQSGDIWCQFHRAVDYEAASYVIHYDGGPCTARRRFGGGTQFYYQVLLERGQDVGAAIGEGDFSGAWDIFWTALTS